MLFSTSCMRLFLTTGLFMFLTTMGATASAVAGININNRACQINDFNDDFNNWEAIGHKYVETIKSPNNSGTGNQTAFIDTFSAETANIVDLAKFLNIEVERLSNLGNVYEGSAMKTSFTVEAGDTLTFDWNFLTNDFHAQQDNDFAFFMLSGLGDTKLADTFSTFSDSLNNPTSFLHQTGIRTASYTFTTAGTYTFGVGVFDVGDGSVDSGLMINNVSLLRRPI